MRDLANAVCKKISYQFPTCPEGKLMFAILEQSILDLYDIGERRTALSHLSGNIPEAQICDVDADWIKRLIKQSGLIIDSKNYCELLKKKQVKTT